jgi:hypothetical protein
MVDPTTSNSLLLDAAGVAAGVAPLPPSAAGAMVVSGTGVDEAPTQGSCSTRKKVLHGRAMSSRIPAPGMVNPAMSDISN